VKRTGKRGLARRTGAATTDAATPTPADGSASTAANFGAEAADGEAAAISTSDLPLHDLFEQQARATLDRADMDEEQRQGLLVAMACPCCGGGAMSYSVKLRSGSKP
jgi:hypothetical protein